MSKFDHSSLCKIAVSWLKRPSCRNGPGCTVAVSETQNNITREIPDAIGWRPFDHGGAGSVVIEVKVSRADFLADRKKTHRFNSETGLGIYRYFLAPEKLIHVDELPDKWGLIEVNASGHLKPARGHIMLQRGESDIWRHEANLPAEVALLAQVLARVGDPQLVQDRIRETSNMLARANARNAKLETRNRELSNKLYLLSEGSGAEKALSQRPAMEKA